jgi:hypothetical protein
MNIGFTFTTEQLEALRRAFGDRFNRRHVVDIRGRVYLPWSRYYLVLQAGRDRREDIPPDSKKSFFRTIFDSVILGLLIGALISGVVVLAMKI